MATEPISAVIVPLPEVDALVGGWRRLHDPSGGAGVVAHVTLLVPFVPPDRLDQCVVRDLREILGAFSPRRLTFSSTARFADTLYLAPQPDEPLRAMTRALVARWPEHPPYDGAHPDPTPHLTIAHGVDEATLAAVSAEVEHLLPIEAHMQEAQVFVGSNERGWSVRGMVPLGT